MAILYSSVKYFTFKKQRKEFDFKNVFNDHNSTPPYLFLLKANDKVYIKEFTKNITTCPICIVDFIDDPKENDPKTLITKCGHKFHKECFKDLCKHSHLKSDNNLKCPNCKENLELKEYIDNFNNETKVKKFKEQIMQVNDINDPLTTFLKEYKEFSESNPNQYFIIDEELVNDMFNSEKIKKDRDLKNVIAARLMHLISKVFYLEPVKNK